MALSEIPVIDFEGCTIHASLNALEQERIGKELYEAFSTIGFAYIKNSGIKRKSIEMMNNVMTTFYEQPLTKKQNFERSFENFGYVGIGVERVDPSQPGDFKEAFDMSGDVAFAEDTAWPDELSPGFSKTCKEFMKECKGLGLRVLEALSKGMMLEDGHGLEESHKLLLMEGSKCALRSLYYPPLPDDFKKQKGQLRLGEHSDYGTITLLFQDDIGGLQVQNTNGEFVEAIPIEDTVLINIGDMLQYMTCGELKSTIHRVLFPRNDKESSCVRRSLVFFVHADKEVVINKPLVYKAGVKKKNHRSNTKPITAHEHAQMKWNATY